MDTLPFTLPDHLMLTRCRHGLMLYPKLDMYVGRSLALYGEFSEGEVDIFRQIIRPGSAVVEIGANIGAHTMALAEITGPGGAVYAFEPQRILYQIVCANIALNGHANIHTRQIGLSNQVGIMRVPPMNYAAENNYGGLGLDNGVGEPVEIHRLDEFSLAPQFIKIDVEGMEGAVLEGARATIMQHRPILYVENDREEKSAALIQLIMSFGYRLWWHALTLFSPDNYRGNSENVFGFTGSINMLCLPREHQVAIGLPEIKSPHDSWRPTAPAYIL